MKNLNYKVLACERCNREWPERRPIIRDNAGEKIVEALHIIPKFCPKCKSPSWNIPRNT